MTFCKTGGGTHTFICEKPISANIYCRFPNFCRPLVFFLLYSSSLCFVSLALTVFDVSIGLSDCLLFTRITLCCQKGFYPYFPAIFGPGFGVCFFFSQLPPPPPPVLIATVFRHFETVEVKKAKRMASCMETLGRNNCGNVNIWSTNLLLYMRKKRNVNAVRSCLRRNQAAEFRDTFL